LTILDTVLDYQPESPHASIFEDVSGSNGFLRTMDFILLLTNWWELNERDLPSSPFIMRGHGSILASGAVFAPQPLR
jgi:hypothetical protein